MPVGHTGILYDVVGAAIADCPLLGREGNVIDPFHIPSARFTTTRWLRHPRALVIRAWAWLCAHTDDLDEKLRCLTAILELEPELEWAQSAPRQVGESLRPEI